VSTDLDLRFEKLSRTMVGMTLFIEKRLMQAYQINPYRAASIKKAIDHMTEALGLSVEAEALADDILQKAMEVLGGIDLNQPLDGRPDPLDAMPQGIKDAAIEMLQDPQLLLRVIQDVEDLGVAGEEEMIATLYLTGTSRLLPRPLATMTTGASSSGKSYVLEQVAMLFPSETKFVVSSTSSKSFYYLPEGSLQHKWVVLGEQARTASEESEDVKRTLREMLSAGRISRAVSLAHNGQISTTIFTQEGPIAFSDSTTQTNQFAEDVNRTVLLHPDESSQQTRAILERLAEERLGGRLSADERTARMETHHALQRMLKQMAIVVPFSPLLARSMNVSNLEMRRGLPLFLAAVEASALLHQLQRPLDEQGRLIASYRDYAIVAELLAGWLVENLAGGISKTTGAFQQWLSDEFGPDQEISVSACQCKGKSEGQANYHLAKLLQAGLIKEVTGDRAGGRGRSRVFRLVMGEMAQRSVGLPAVEEVRDFCSERAE
jgi:hypothetical protein